MLTTTQTAVSAPAAATPFIPQEQGVPEVLIQQTQDATIDAFTKICGEVEIVSENETDFTNCMKIDGIISFVGDLTWSLILVFPMESAEMMAKKFAGFDIPFDSEDMGDVVGELTNVLAGVLCGNLENEGVKSQMSLPTVTRGSNFEQLMSDSLISHKIYFLIGDDQYFMVKLVVAQQK